MGAGAAGVPPVPEGNVAAALRQRRLQPGAARPGAPPPGSATAAAAAGASVRAPGARGPDGRRLPRGAAVPGQPGAQKDGRQFAESFWRGSAFGKNVHRALQHFLILQTQTE